MSKRPPDKWKAEDVAIGLQGSMLQQVGSKVDEALSSAARLKENNAKISDVLDRLEAGEQGQDALSLCAPPLVSALPDIPSDIDWEALTAFQPELDPLSLVFGLEGLSAAHKEAVFETTGGPLTGFDYTIVGTAITAGILLDLMVVAAAPLPANLRSAGSWKAFQSPVTKLLNDTGSKLHAKELAPWIGAFSKAAESVAKVPFDRSPPGAGFTPFTHRLHSVGHHASPLGLAVGMIDVIQGSITYVDQGGSIRRVATDMAARDLMTGWQLTILHWISDTFTPVSLPAPSLLPLQTWDGLTPFKHPKTGVTLKGRPLAATQSRRAGKHATLPTGKEP